MTDSHAPKQTCAYEHCDTVVPEWSAFCSRACERAVFMSPAANTPVSADGAMLSSLPPPRRHKAPRGSLRNTGLRLLSSELSQSGR